MIKLPCVVLIFLINDKQNQASNSFTQYVIEEDSIY
jgi:hypothetical protein